MTPPEPEVSVVIPTRDKAPRLRLTLAALAAQTERAFEVVVVNDGSEDETEDVIRSVGAGMPRLRCVQGGGRGRSAARNRGAAAAAADLLLFLDDDILVVPSFIAAHRAGQSGGACFLHGRIREMALVARLRDPASPVPGVPPLLPDRLAREGFDVAGHRLLTSSLEQAVEAMFLGGHPCVAPWLAGAGANFSLPRTIWDRHGGFDGCFASTWGCEDLEHALRLADAGVPIRFSPAALGVHLTHQRADRWEQHAKNLQRFIALHPRDEVRALPLLLGPEGSSAAYLAAVGSQKRCP